MGGCATKPKVSKADAGELPVQPAAEEVVVVVAAKEEKKVADGELVIEEKVKEIVESDDAKVDDEPGSNKRRSLSLLFKENPEEKSVATEKIMIEAVKEAEPTKEPEKSKPEEVTEILKTNEPAETKPEEKSITSLEQPPVPSAVENAEEEKTIEEVKTVDDNPSVSTNEPPAVIVTEDSAVADKENTIEEAKPAPEPTASASKPDDKAKQTEPEKENPYEKMKDQAVKEV